MHGISFSCIWKYSYNAFVRIKLTMIGLPVASDAAISTMLYNYSYIYSDPV